MSPTIIAVLCAAVVALVVGGIGLALVRRGSAPEDQSDLVSSADRLAEAQVSPFGPSDPMPASDEPPVERVSEVEVIGTGAPIWSGARQEDAPAPSPAPEVREPMFPPPHATPPEPAELVDHEPGSESQAELATEPDAEFPFEPLEGHDAWPSPDLDDLLATEPVPQRTQSTEEAWETEDRYDPEAVLRELRGSAPASQEESTQPTEEWTQPMEEEIAPAFAREPLGAFEFDGRREVADSPPAGTATLEPPSWAPPGADGHPPKVMHRSVMPIDLAAGVETEWFLLTPVEALGTWPASNGGQGASGGRDTWTTARSGTPVRPAEPTITEQKVPHREPVPPHEAVSVDEAVKLPDSLLADLLGGIGGDAEVENPEGGGSDS